MPRLKWLASLSSRPLPHFPEENQPWLLKCCSGCGMLVGVDFPGNQMLSQGLLAELQCFS